MTDQAVSKTLIELLDAADPSSVAIRVPGGPSVTYDSLKRQVYSLAGQLRGLGIGRNDRVAIVMPNSIESIISFLGVSAVAIAAPLNQAYKEDEFKFYMEDINSRVLITGSQEGDAARAAAAESTIQIDASLEDSGEVVYSVSGSGKDTSSSSPDNPNPDDVALVLHTSGTTSRPKRVPLTHANLVTSTRNIVKTYGLNPDDNSMCVMPLFHIHGLVASTLSTFASGGTVVVPQRFGVLGFWRLVQETGATWYSAVPTIHQSLLHRASGAGGLDSSLLQSLRFIRSCSAPLSSAVMLEMEERFGVPVVEAYGMTEASHQMTSNLLPPGDRVPGTVGVETGVSMGIMDEAGNLLSPGSRGEVVTRGANVIDAYEDNPEANATSFTNGWFRTGDEGVVDARGYLSLVGRLKEMINRSGEKISPLEIDDVLMAHPAVGEAVAFGIPSAVHGEEPSAAVVLSGEATESDLIAYCRERLADFKCPRTIHIVESIPRTATGKVQRRIVAQVIVGS
jgi:acyl-CoA synthetase (AMP-forming)/AMP-acid ligase II